MKSIFKEANESRISKDSSKNQEIFVLLVFMLKVPQNL